ncbi:MAG: trypsin-like peptidase domain-containing protein [Bdellovibrionales bacterium]|nr:trypsin-like peptidase domain-containing protein [Bdellovibrionales bacterium]
MQTRLYIRFNRLVIQTIDLPAGTYEVGRSEECDIQIQHPTIHRRHGQLQIAEKGCSFTEHGTHKVHSINQDSPVQLSDEIEIVTEDFMSDEKTDDIDIKRKNWQKIKKRKTIYGSLGILSFILIVVGAYLLVKSQFKSDPNELLTQVRSKIVEFERIKDPTAIAEYKSYGQYTDEDFRDQYGYCTGFLVAPNVVLSAAHCLWGSDFLDLYTSFEIRAFDDKKFKVKRVLGFDAVRDFVYLQMEGMESYGHLNFADSFNVGQTVYTLGNAHGQGIAIREGIMASETADLNDPTIKYIRYSAGASPGNSGGPLLDTQGHIVALVFAATGAENYNLGTSVKDLKVGFEKFVTDQKPKSVSIVLRRLLNFNGYQFLQKQLMPFLPDYGEYPELIQKINNQQLEFKMPLVFEDVAKETMDEVHKKSLEVISEIETELRAKNETILDWTSYVTEKTPAILPSQFDQSQNNFYLHNNRYYMNVSGFLDSPNRKDFRSYIETFDKEKKFDFQAYGMNTDLVIPEKKSQIIYYLPKDVSKGKKMLEDLSQGAIYSQTWITKENLDDEKVVDTFIKKYLGDDGVISGSYSAFIKPQAYKNFTISKIDKPAKLEKVVDGSGRSWNRFHLKLFDQIHIYIYCTSLPEGLTCVSRMLPVDDDYRREITEGSFRQRILAHFLENPYFWEPKALFEFLAQQSSQSFSSFKGVALKEADSAYKLNLQGFHLQLDIPKNAQSVRLQTGMYLNPQKKVIWTGYGAEWIEAKSKQLCGVGVEPLPTQSIYILNFMRDSLKKLKLKEDQKDIEVPKLWTEKISNKEGVSFQLYGYCAPIRENPMETGYFFADLKKAKPHKVVFKKL